MNGQPADVPSGGEPASGVEPDDSPALDPAPSAQAAPTLAEDLLLLLFQPGAGGRGSGAIAGEGTLFYVLAGAVVTELALGGHVRPEGDGGSAARVEAVAGRPPADALLHKAWEYIAVKPRGMQTVLAAIGPMLRKPVLDRVVARGDIRRTSRRALGLFETTVLSGDGGERRASLLEAVRTVLAEGAEPTPRVAALAALLSGSGTLPQFYREIPWNSAVATRGKQLEQGDWGASAASEAVVRTLTAIVVSSVVVATQPRT
ncbi:Golgi phosphoprotein 3 (GPP34) [Agrococcus baldri]|uniref:Golgi phosphoprotein 3 (GPP34) n=1 Tax=Agrococcus baldri TaxID=153730 RepID=A0AA94HLR1_9MICO|nr:GPP34 family phosphoprotein [Agrococcus baldri]SFS08625.1 Golgi phosphoprotein 3 (GPP34) [Agrococcus baldri]